VINTITSNHSPCFAHISYVIVLCLDVNGLLNIFKSHNKFLQVTTKQKNSHIRQKSGSLSQKIYMNVSCVTFDFLWSWFVHVPLTTIYEISIIYCTLTGYNHNLNLLKMIICRSSFDHERVWLTGNSNNIKLSFLINKC
jgi:hypothetical protein